MVRSHKSRFHDKPNDVTRLAELAVSSDFLHAVDAAFCQFVFNQSAPKDAHESMIGSHKVQGAKEFIVVLLTLADKMEVPKRAVSIGNLPGNVRSDSPPENK